MRIEIEGIVHRTCRMMCRNIERFEVMVIVFNLGPLLDGIAGAGEEMLNPLQGAGNRVQAAQVLATADHALAQRVREYKAGLEQMVLDKVALWEQEGPSAPQK